MSTSSVYPVDPVPCRDGKPFAGDPATIKLSDQLEIAIVIGTPPAVIPSVFSGG